MQLKHLHNLHVFFCLFDVFLQVNTISKYDYSRVKTLSIEKGNGCQKFLIPSKTDIEKTDSHVNCLSIQINAHSSLFTQQIIHDYSFIISTYYLDYEVVLSV